MKKRIICLLLVFIVSFLCAVVFNGCGSWVNVELLKYEFLNERIEGLEYADLRDLNYHEAVPSIVIRDESDWREFCVGKEFFESKKQNYGQEYFYNNAIVIVAFLDNADYDYEFELKEMYGGAQGGRWVEGKIFKNVREKDYDYSDHYVVLFAEVEESNFNEIKNLSFDLIDYFEWCKVSNNYDVGAVDLKNLSYLEDWGSVNYYATIIESVDELQELIGENEEAKSFFSEYLIDDAYFTENVLILLPFVDNEVGEYSVEIYFSNNHRLSTAIYVKRNLGNPRQSVEFNQKVLISLECERAYVPISTMHLIDNYTMENKFAEFGTISELFESGKFSSEDLIDIAWNTENTKNNPSIFANLDEEDSRQLNVLNQKKFMTVVATGYFKYLYAKNLKMDVELEMTYYGYYNGYFLFSYKCLRENKLPQTYSFTVGGVNFTFNSYSNIYALKDCVIEGRDLGVTLTKEDQNNPYMQREKFITFITSREELEQFCSENRLKSSSLFNFEKLNEEFFAENVILVSFSDLSGVHCFDGTAHVYYHIENTTNNTYCKLYAYSRGELELFEDVKVEMYT